MKSPLLVSNMGFKMDFELIDEIRQFSGVIESNILSTSPLSTLHTAQAKKQKKPPQIAGASCSILFGSDQPGVELTPTCAGRRRRSWSIKPSADT